MLTWDIFSRIADAFSIASALVGLLVWRKIGQLRRDLVYASVIPKYLAELGDLCRNINLYLNDFGANQNLLLTDVSRTKAYLRYFIKHTAARREARSALRLANRLEKGLRKSGASEEMVWEIYRALEVCRSAVELEYRHREERRHIGA